MDIDSEEEEDREEILDYENDKEGLEVKDRKFG